MLALVDGLKTFAVVFVAPHASPEGLVVGSDHAAFAAGGHYFVLAKAPSSGVANAANGAAFVACAVGLSAVFDHVEVVLGS